MGALRCEDTGSLEGTALRQIPDRVAGSGQVVVGDRVHGMAGTLACAWPGCPRRAWDRRGTCSFHWLVAWGLIEN